MSLPRALARAYARANGYFWLPCAVCGKEFGGHEWRGYEPGAIAAGSNTGRAICRRCNDGLLAERCPRQDGGYFVWPPGEIARAQQVSA